MRMIKWLLAVVVLVVVGGAAWGTFGRPSDDQVVFKTAEVKRGDLVATISATGTVEPEEVARRFTAENTLIGGCISCTRLI